MELKGTTKEEIIRELERKSNDSIKIYNPTFEEFRFRWNGYEWHCPGNKTDEGFGMGCMIVPRYIANHYVKHMCDKLIMRESDRVVNAAKKKYTGSNWAQEEERIALRTNNPLLIEKYAKMLWKGKVRDYGLDRPVVEEQEDKRPDQQVHLSILDKLEEQSQRVAVEAPTPEPQGDIQSLSYINEIAETDDIQG